MTKTSRWKTMKESEARWLKGFIIRLTFEPTLRAVRET
jgi:hypothetical protein